MCGNMKFISSVDQGILRVSKADEWDALFNTRNNFIFPSIHVLFGLLGAIHTSELVNRESLYNSFLVLLSSFYWKI